MLSNCNVFLNQLTLRNKTCWRFIVINTDTNINLLCLVEIKKSTPSYAILKYVLVQTGNNSQV